MKKLRPILMSFILLKGNKQTDLAAILPCDDRIFPKGETDRAGFMFGR